MNKLTILAKQLRQNQTPQEQKLWNIIRNHKFNNLKFKRQQPIWKYIVDFLCKDIKLIIEIDGGQHNTPENILTDAQRTQFLQSKGYKVIRFWNNEIDKNLEGCLNFILEELNNTPLRPSDTSPARGADTELRYIAPCACAESSITLRLYFLAIAQIFSIWTACP